MDYVGLITVRTSSSRLKKKCLLNIGKYTKVIEHVILRCLGSGIKPILCTTKKKTDDVLVLISKKLGIDFFRGSEKNKIKRWHDCAKQYNLRLFHTIDADDLYFDIDAIKNSISLLKNKKLDAVYPSIASRYGGASEGYSFSKQGIKKIFFSLKNLSYNSESCDTEMIDPFLDKANLKYQVFKGQHYEIKKKIRLTLDYPEDLKMFKLLFNKFGIYSKRNDINNFLKKNKNILKINLFRNKDWKNIQDAKIKKNKTL
jgi:spore coat polysaccharide biosynthesis protein SpsF